MTISEDLETRVDDVLRSDTVSKAQRLLGSRSGVVMVSVVSFIESALPLPLLTDPFLVAAILANRANIVRLVVATTLASIVGGLMAYLMASLFLEMLLHWMTSSMVEQFQTMVDSNHLGTFMLTLVGAVTPVPYTIVCWVVAVLKGNLLAFVAASAIGRGGRYLIVGYSTYHFGQLAVQYAKRYIGILSIVVFVIAALYVWLRM